MVRTETSLGLLYGICSLQSAAGSLCRTHSLQSAMSLLRRTQSALSVFSCSGFGAQGGDLQGGEQATWPLSFLVLGYMLYKLSAFLLRYGYPVPWLLTACLGKLGSGDWHKSPTAWCPLLRRGRRIFLFCSLS